jgi:hypothetical protein
MTQSTSILVTAIVATLIIACRGQTTQPSQDSSSVFDQDGGTSDLAYRAYVHATIHPEADAGTDPNVECNRIAPFDIGAAGGAAIADGTSLPDGSELSVGCEVVPRSDSGFDVHAFVTSAPSGDEATSLNVDGTFPAASPGTTRASFVDARGLHGSQESFSQNDCSLTYPNIGQAPIAAGRVWALLSCPNASGCDVQAEIKLENCLKEWPSAR